MWGPCRRRRVRMWLAGWDLPLWAELRNDCLGVLVLVVVVSYRGNLVGNVGDCTSNCVLVEVRGGYRGAWSAQSDVH